MSIILKALEKAEKEKKIEIQHPLPSPPAERQHRVPEKKETDAEIKVLSIDSPVRPFAKTIETKPKPIKPNYPKRIFISSLIISIIALGGINLFNTKSAENHDALLPVTAPSFPKITFETNTHLDEKPPVKITGVLWDELDPTIIANGKFVKKGEEISGAKILDIQLHEVKLLYKDKEFTISIQ